MGCSFIRIVKIVLFSTGKLLMWQEHFEHDNRYLMTYFVTNPRKKFYDYPFSYALSASFYHTLCPRDSWRDIQCYFILYQYSLLEY